MDSVHLAGDVSFLDGDRRGRLDHRRQAARQRGGEFNKEAQEYVLANRNSRDGRYERLVTEKLCRPLDMIDTATILQPEQVARVATGYRTSVRVGNLALGVEASPWNLPDHLAGAGALRSTATDMRRYLGANMGMASSVLTNAIARSHQSLFRSNDQTAFGMHWIRTKRDAAEPTILWHNGGTGGYRSFIGFTEDRRFGVVLLSNTAKSVDALGFEIVEALAREFTRSLEHPEP